MLSKELLYRLMEFVIKIHANESFLEKYLRKLKSEGTIRDYRVIGKSLKINSISLDVLENSVPYRVILSYKDNQIFRIDVVNQDDTADNFYKILR